MPTHKSEEVKLKSRSHGACLCVCYHAALLDSHLNNCSGKHQTVPYLYIVSKRSPSTKYIHHGIVLHSLSVATLVIVLLREGISRCWKRGETIVMAPPLVQ